MPLPQELDTPDRPEGKRDARLCTILTKGTLTPTLTLTLTFTLAPTPTLTPQACGAPASPPH